MNLPSPISTVTFNNFTFDVKRDDLIDPYISGNKWRKLKHILAKAQQLGKKHLVTFGGAYSNHLVATAASGAKFGFKTTAFVRGEAVTNEMLTICKLYGMQLLFVNREEYKDKVKLFDDHFGGESNAFFIDEGGACAEATLGCAEIIDELNACYDHIFCAAGTGTTAAGLLKGINEKTPNTQLQVIQVLKGQDFITAEVGKYVAELAQLKVHTNYHFGGYAKFNNELLDFIKNFTATTGILADQVYTGKLFYAVTDLLKNGIIGPTEKILVVHTGGLLGLLGIKDHL